MSLIDLLTFRKPSASATPRTEPAGLLPLAGSSHYPSVDPGIAAVSVAEILAAEDELLKRFKYCYGSDPATFERDILDPIRAYASYVNLLPATADNFFCGAGGLFKLGLEVAFYALQGTDAHIVSGRATISVRKELEPRWRQATFLAGLCSELHRTLSHAAVTDEHGNEWPAYLMPLSKWLQQRKARRFFVRWIANAPESRGLSLFPLPHIVPPETMQHLSAGNNTVVPQMLASITGLPLLHEQSILIELVKRSAALVIDRDLVASAHRYGKPILGAHIERYLLDAMRRLVASHAAWSPNTERSRVWLGEDGLFIVWPNAAAEIRKVLEDDELRGIPKSPETIVEILTAAGVLQAPPGGHALWSIQPPGATSTIEAVRLSSPDILLAGQTRPCLPLQQPLIARVGSAPVRGQTHAPSVPMPGAVSPVAPKASPAAAVAPALATPEDSADAHQGNLDLEPSAHPGTVDHGASQPPVTTEPSSAAARALEPAQPIRFSLKAPMRLVPQVRQALALAIDSLNGDAAEASAVTVATGVFVPVEHFKSQKVDVSVALRSLAEVDMLVGTKDRRARTYQHDIRGQEQPGVIVKPTHVDGLDPSDFRIPD